MPQTSVPQMDGDPLKASFRPIACPSCGLPAQEVTLFGRRFTECGPCAAIEEERRAAAARRDRALAAWRANPADMRQPLDWARVNPVLLPARETDPFRGVGLVGRHDTGKTRIGYWLLGRLAMEHGVTGLAVRHSEFRRAASSQNASDSRVADDARSLLARCRTVKALLIDDIGKGATTDTADEAFFDLVDYRLNNQLLTHWTTNGSGKWLEERLGPDRGPAIVRRLRNLAWGSTFVVPA